MKKLKPIYLFDLDGTLADMTHRLHFVKNGNKNWHSFYHACVDDQPISEMIHLLRVLKASGSEIWIVSGRSDEVMAETAYWFDSYSVPYDVLLMRTQGDYRPDNLVKQEMLDNMLDVDRNRVVMAFDDRSRVVDMWRANGIRCLQVTPGDF